jgi:hypothetical protein
VKSADERPAHGRVSGVVASIRVRAALLVSGDDLPRTQVVCSQEDLIQVEEQWRAALDAKGWSK